MRAIPFRPAALAGALLLCACTGKIDFTITKDFDVNATSATYSYTQAVDIQAEAHDAWKHRNKVKSIDMIALEGTILTVTHLPAIPTTGGGTITLVPDAAEGGASVQVGHWPSSAIPATPGTTLAVVLDNEATDLISRAIKGSGRFTVQLDGTISPAPSAGNAATFTAEVKLHLKLNYKVI